MRESQIIDYIFTKNVDIVKYRHIDDKRINNLCIYDHLPILIVELNNFKFTASELLKGGKLELEMGPEPNKDWGN